MDICNKCRTARLNTSVLPEHTEDLGGITVTLRNAVLLHRCPECGEEMTEIPNSRMLYAAVALKRVMVPFRLTAGDIRFLRAVFDMTQAQFADAIGLENAQTISRWENGARPIGEHADRFIRYVIYALLHKAVPAADYDPNEILEMRVQELANGQPLPPLVFDRVIINQDHRREEGWDALPGDALARAA